VVVAMLPPLDLGLHAKKSFAGDEDERVQELLGREARAVLRMRERGARLRADDSSLALEGKLDWTEEGGMVTAFRWLESLVAAVAAIKKRRETVRVASAVSAFESGLLRFAKERGLSVIRCPLLAFGNVDDVGLTIAAERTGDGLHAMHARLWPDGERFAGISVVPHERSESSVDGSIITLSDEAFDRVFRVCVGNPKAARAALDESVRGLLCKLYDQFSNVSLTDGALDIADVPLDSNEPNTMAEMGERLLALAPSLAGLQAGGPYR
jgi:hypothetical protein